MSELNNDYNLDDLENMSKEGLEHFNNDEALKNIESEALKQIESRLSTEVIKPVKSNMPKLIILLVILLGLSFFLITKIAGGNNNQNLYASNYEAPPFLLSSTERSSDSSVDAIADIKNLYAQKNYNACLEAMTANNNALLKENTNLELYQAICLLEQDNASMAAEVLSNPAIEIEDVRLWYLSLAQISKGDQNAAKATLQSLIDLPGTYKEEEATSILEKLQ